MAKITRETQKIFGSTAGSDQMAEFGSFAAGVPQTFSGSTITPAIVQSLSNYLSGWFAAVVGNNSPFIEDINAIFYLFSYQVAYLMQAGIAEWDSGTTYYIGSLVTDGTGLIYSSRIDSNTSALSNGDSWGSVNLNGLQIPNSISSNKTVPTGSSLFWPYCSVSASAIITVNTGAEFVGVSTLVLTGTATIIFSGTAIGRIL